jgi:hypothetical protein
VFSVLRQLAGIMRRFVTERTAGSTLGVTSKHRYRYGSGQRRSPMISANLYYSRLPPDALYVLWS